MKQPCRRQMFRFHTHSVQQPVLQLRLSWLHFKAYCLLFLWLIFLELRKRKATYNEYYRGFLGRMISKARVRFRATLQSHNLVFLAIFIIYTMCVLALLRMTNQVRQLPLLICAFHATHPFWILTRKSPDTTVSEGSLEFADVLKEDDRAHYSSKKHASAAIVKQITPVPGRCNLNAW